MQCAAPPPADAVSAAAGLEHEGGDTRAWELPLDRPDCLRQQVGGRRPSAGSRPSSTGRGDGVEQPSSSSRSTSLSNCDVSPETVARICQPSAGGCCDFSVRRTPVARRARPRRPSVGQLERHPIAWLVPRDRVHEILRDCNRLSVDADHDVAGLEARLLGRAPPERHRPGARPRLRRPPRRRATRPAPSERSCSSSASEPLLTGPASGDGSPSSREASPRTSRRRRTTGCRR